MSVRTRRKAPDAARNGASEHAAQVAKREVAQCRAQSRLAVDHGKGSRRAACTHCSEMNLRRAEAAHKARQPLVSALESHAELPPCHPTLQAQIAPATPNAARAPREGLLVSRRRAAYFVRRRQHDASNSLFEIVHGRFRICIVIDNTISHAPRILNAEHAR